MAYQYATYEKRGHVAYVTINRPEVMNALHPAASAELSEIWDGFAADPDAWVGVLTGAGDRQALQAAGANEVIGSIGSLPRLLGLE